MGSPYQYHDLGEYQFPGTPEHDEFSTSYQDQDSINDPTSTIKHISASAQGSSLEHSSAFKPTSSSFAQDQSLDRDPTFKDRSASKPSSAFAQDQSINQGSAIKDQSTFEQDITLERGTAFKHNSDTFAQDPFHDHNAALELRAIFERNPATSQGPSFTHHSSIKDRSDSTHDAPFTHNSAYKASAVASAQDPSIDRDSAFKNRSTNEYGTTLAQDEPYTHHSHHEHRSASAQDQYFDRSSAYKDRSTNEYGTLLNQNEPYPYTSDYEHRSALAQDEHYTHSSASKHYSALSGDRSSSEESTYDHHFYGHSTATTLVNLDDSNMNVLRKRATGPVDEIELEIEMPQCTMADCPLKTEYPGHKQGKFVAPDGRTPDGRAFWKNGVPPVFIAHNYVHMTAGIPEAGEKEYRYHIMCGGFHPGFTSRYWKDDNVRKFIEYHSGCTCEVCHCGPEGMCFCWNTSEEPFGCEVLKGQAKKGERGCWAAVKKFFGWEEKKILS